MKSYLTPVNPQIAPTPYQKVWEGGARGGQPFLKGSPLASSASGYTLMEMLAAMVIVAMVAGAVAGLTSRQMRSEVKLEEKRLELAAAEAALSQLAAMKAEGKKPPWPTSLELPGFAADNEDNMVVEVRWLAQPARGPLALYRLEVQCGTTVLETSVLLGGS